MKRNSLLKAFNLTVLIAAISLTMMSTSAQTSVEPVIRLTEDTTIESLSPIGFDVQITGEEDGQKFLLLVNNPLAEKLKVSITAPEGIGFMDQTKSLSYRKRISMVDAQDGNYLVTVSSDKRTYTKKVQLHTAIVQTRSIQVN